MVQITLNQCYCEIFQALARSLAMTEICIALTTCPDQQVAREIANRLVEEKVAACVNIVPAIESIYQWEGKIEHDNEYLLIIKSNLQRIEKAYNVVLCIHPYDVPEWLVIDIASGGQPYLDWMRSTLK